MAGTTVVCDRYAYSGVAFSASKPGEYCCRLADYTLLLLRPFIALGLALHGGKAVSDKIACRVTTYTREFRFTCGSLLVVVYAEDGP